jgi:hypothetical protein
MGNIERPLGQILRLPCKFIKSETTVTPIVVQQIAQRLKTIERNVLPPIVRETSPDRYRAIHNGYIVEAAKAAQQDFVWCIIVDKAMESQLQVELGEVVRVNLGTDSESVIASFFEFIKSQDKSFAKIQSAAVANAVINYRQANRPKDLNFLTKLKCGIGKTKISALQPYVVMD